MDDVRLAGETFDRVGTSPSVRGISWPMALLEAPSIHVKHIVASALCVQVVRKQALINNAWHWG